LLAVAFVLIGVSCLGLTSDLCQIRKPYRYAVTSICTKHAIHREHGWSSAISNMEPSSGLLFSECPIFSAFPITVFYTVAFLLLLFFFAVPSYLPIHFTTAEFSASTGGS
jgi:hypothetical protein